MSKKDYIRVARILADTPINQTTRATLAIEFANFFEEENEFFDRQKFYGACGV